MQIPGVGGQVYLRKQSLRRRKTLEEPSEVKERKFLKEPHYPFSKY